AFEELGYYRAQGDNQASPNPPTGALLTYYLREDIGGGAKAVLTVTDATGKQVRQLDIVSRAGVHRAPWDLRESAPAGPAGGRGRGANPQQPPAADGETETPPPTVGRGGRGGFGGVGGRGGPMVKPGSYTVTLGKSVNGMVTPIGKPQTVE